MANLYRKPIIITDPKTGERVKAKAKKWWGRYKDEHGIERRVPLAIDKTAAQAMLNEIVKKKERLASGVIDKFDDERKRPLAEHLREFEKHLRAKRVSNEQIKLVIYRAQKIIEKCRAKVASDLKSSRVQSFLAELRDEGKSIQTSNHYLRAIKQLTRWIVKDRRSHDDSLQFVSMLNVSTDRRHDRRPDRRPLSEAEFSALLHAARTGRPSFKMACLDRAMLYTVAAYTGLRASELASLTRHSFRLDDETPTVTVKAAYSKHHRQDTLPLHPSLVALLRPWLQERTSAEMAWPGKWAESRHAGQMMKADLESAGIPYVDAHGLYADFHALRHTFITNMMKAGINPRLPKRWRGTQRSI